ncbi:phage scaffolding protein [Streptomyces microflavus]
MENETATQERPNDVNAMEAQVKKANGEAAHYRNERNTFREMAIGLKAERTLSDAGINNPKVKKLLNLSEITVTESGDLEGLTEQLDSLKEDFPELFGVTKRVSGGGDAANKQAVTAKPKNSATALIGQLKGN